MENSEFKKELRNLKPYDHICMLYEEFEQWYYMVVSYLISGLERNEKCIYIWDQHTPEFICECFSHEGVDPALLIDSKQLQFINARELFLDENGIDTCRPISLLMQAGQQASNNGYASLRICTEMNWVLQYKANSRLLIEFEARINRYLLSRRPDIVLCQYKLGQFDHRLIKDVIKTHPLIMHNAQICKNPYYMPPHAFLSKNGEAAELTHLIKMLNIEHAKQNYSNFLANALENSGQAFIAIYPDGRLLKHNRAFQLMLGYSDEEMQKITRDVDLTPFEFQGIQAEIQEKLRITGKPQRFEKEYICKDKSRLPVELNVHQLCDAAGNIESYYAFVNDISERKQIEKSLESLRLHDLLTGLPNRLHFEQKLKELEKQPLNSISLIVCAMDGLKLVNEIYGHDRGDSLLLKLAYILRQCFSDDTFIARTGGDQFVVLLTDVNSAIIEESSSIIRNAVFRYQQETDESLLNISLAFTSISKDYEPQTILEEAENTMYCQKLLNLYNSRNVTTQILNKTLEAKDYGTEGHSCRLQELVAVLAAAHDFPVARINDLKLLAEYHDIGKIGVPGHILAKRGPLSNEEIRRIQRHTHIGYNIAVSSHELALIANWILKHHEWWNGQGYPLGIAGEQIPLECRILAIAAAYEAMTSNRPYRKAMSKKNALLEIQRCAGAQFDPYLTSLFVKAMNRKHLSAVKLSPVIQSEIEANNI